MSFDPHPHERRSTRRVPLDIQITVQFTEGDIRWTETDATLVDLSSEGMYIRCDRIPRHGQDVLVGLMHHRGDLCAAWGETVRLNDEGGVGVKFRRISNSLNDLVRELITLSNGVRDALPVADLDARVWIESPL